MIARRLVFFVALVFLSLTAASAADDLAPLRALSRGEPLAMRGLPRMTAPRSDSAWYARWISGTSRPI